MFDAYAGIDRDFRLNSNGPSKHFQTLICCRCHPFLAGEILYCWFLVKKGETWWLYSLPLIGGSSPWFWSIQQLGFGDLIESLFCSMNSTVSVASRRCGLLRPPALPKQDHHVGLSQNKVPPAKLMVDHHLFHSNCCLLVCVFVSYGYCGYPPFFFCQKWSRQKVFVKVCQSCAMVSLQDFWLKSRSGKDAGHLVAGNFPDVRVVYVENSHVARWIPLFCMIFPWDPHPGCCCFFCCYYDINPTCVSYVLNIFVLIPANTHIYIYVLIIINIYVYIKKQKKKTCVCVCMSCMCLPIRWFGGIG